LHIRSALEDAADQGEVGIGGPVAGPREDVLIPTVDQERGGRGTIPVHGSDGKICDLV
jgi:hypothetical protein